MKSKYNRFLIIRTDRIGDVILTLPMAKVVKHCFPGAHVAMLIRRYTSELAEDCEYVDDIIYYDEKRGAPVPFFRMVQQLREQHFDVAVHTQPRERLAFITALASIPTRIGTGFRWYSFMFNNKIYEHRKDALRHELEYNLNLLSGIGVSYEGIAVQPHIRVQPRAVGTIQNLLIRAGIMENERIVIIHPGSGGSARDWSARKFGELAHLIGNISSVRVVITGKKEEEHLVNTIASIAGTPALPLAGFGTLREFAALAQRASLFIANSTGPIHLAAAVNTPVIGLYPQITALSATRWGPYTDNKLIFSPNNKTVDCNVCQLKKTGICECMETISVEEVYRAALQCLRIA